MRIVNMQTASRDYGVVASAFFERQRPDGRTPLISRGTHTVLKVRQAQNCSLLSRVEAERKIMHRKRGQDTVELTCDCAWHSSGKTQPDSIAAGSGLMIQFGSEQGFYVQGNYSAHQASYSHHERYATGRLTLRATIMPAAASTFICCWLVCCAASPSRPLRCGRESAFAPCRTN